MTTILTDEHQENPSSPPQRVAIHQPALPKYRIPVFKELASRQSIALTLYHDTEEGIPSVEPDGFSAQTTRTFKAKTPLGQLMFSTIQCKLASKKHCDTLILPGNTRYLSLLPALLKAKISGVRTILWGHFYSKNESPWRRWLRQLIPSFADGLLFYNTIARDQYLAANWDANKLFVAPNAIDQTPIQDAQQYWLDRPDKLKAFQQENDLDTGPVILFVSRLDPANRLDLLIKALVLMTEQLPTAQVVIIGKGEQEQRRLKQLAHEQGVSGRVHFLGPIYDEKQLAPYFLSSHVFCYPANIGLSILHAFGYGLPVITSDKTEAQNPEIICLQTNENGLTYQDGKSSDLARTLLYVLENNSIRQRLSENAYQTANTRFSVQVMVDGFVEAIHIKA